MDEQPTNSDDEETGPATTTATTTELSLRLDADGRTTYDPALLPPPPLAASSAPSAPASTEADDAERRNHSESKRARVETPPETKTSDVALDYTSRTALTNLASSLDDRPSKRKSVDDLLFDCEIADCGLLPRTFWVSAEGTNPPRCYLEQLALEVFRRHVPSPSSSDVSGGGSGFYYDPATSGAEWWVQLRPSPPGTGRYSMLACEDDVTRSGISFHWDKDEDLRLATGGMHIHPHISTVTYLTDLGAPTMVLSKRVDPMTGEHSKEEEGGTEGFVSWPRRGKHLSFDGRYLHAAPSDLMEEGLFEKQCQYDVRDKMDEKIRKVLARRHRRVTFLVNIWLNYKPFNVEPFPEMMIKNLSGVDLFGDLSLFDEDSGGSGGDSGKDKDTEANAVETDAVIVRGGKASMTDRKESCDDVGDAGGQDAKLTKMIWPMGQKDEERIEVLVPLEAIRGCREAGSDVAITWHDGVVLGGAGA